ncbi:MAG: GEVED domain-containing protein [Bacteroidetes bacterium]|nr:GEVED domain-containing protein [Bacteroidota bacterium]
MIVKLKIKNYGTQSIINFPIRYSINGQVPVTETVTTQLNPQDTLTYAFNIHANLSAYQTYHFKGWLDVTGDVNHINDTVYIDVVNSMFTYCISTATNPNDDDIGNVTISNLNHGIATPSTSNPSSTNMYSDFTGLPPILLTKGQSYSISVSQIDLNGFYNCCVKVFVDWDYSGDFDELSETAFIGGPTASTNPTLTGTINVPVNAHIGPTRFRVVLQETSDPSYVHACGTYTWGETEDYTALIMPQLAIDAGITAIVAPPLTYPQGFTGPIQITVKDFGTNPITNMNVAYKLDNNAPVSLGWTGNLTTNNTTTVNFPAITWPNGLHSFCAFVTLVNDSNSFNDTLCRSILGVPVDTLPYYDNFDGPVVKFTTASSTGTNWLLGPPDPSIFPNTAVSSPNVWGTNLGMSGGYSANALCYLTTQIFDFTNAINASISFYFNHSTDPYGDGTRLEYSLDGGTTWTTLGTVSDPLGINWYNYTLWSSRRLEKGNLSSFRI